MHFVCEYFALVNSCTNLWLCCIIRVEAFTSKNFPLFKKYIRKQLYNMR